MILFPCFDRWERLDSLRKMGKIRNLAREYNYLWKENLTSEEYSRLGDYLFEMSQITNELKGIQRYSTQTIKSLVNDYRGRIIDILAGTEELVK